MARRARAAARQGRDLAGRGGALARRHPKWIIPATLVAALAVLVGGGLVVNNLVRGKINAAVPHEDLFGDESPSPSPSGAPSPTASPLPPGASIRGPLNILIAGVDTRESQPRWQPNADAVMVLHIAKDLRSAYLTSLPRDLLVNIPAFPANGYGGGRTKLTHAMAYGSRVNGSSRPSTAQGFQLLARTVSRYTGITRFDAGAVLTFTGMRRLFDAVGGVDMRVDQRVVSIHLTPDGSHRPRGASSTGYVGPQMVYEKGMHHFVGWQALDYARQRYTAGADYTRQRHQRQLLKALAAKLVSRDLLTNPTKLDAVLKALGRTLTFDGRGRPVADYAFALRNLRPSTITLVGLPGSSVGSGSGYRGEQLNSIASSYFAAVRADRVGAFLASHPTLVNRG